MNLTLGLAFYIALLQLNLSILGAEITLVSSSIHDAQTLLQIADEFLYCFMDQSSKKISPTGQTYTNAVSRVIRSFAPQNNGPLSKAEAKVFQTRLATSIADDVDGETQLNDHPQIFPVVLQLISDCFTEITGYQPSKLIRSIATFLEILSEDTDLEWNSISMGKQRVLSKVQSSENFVNQTRSKTSMENSKTVSTNEIDQLAYDRRPRQTSQSFAAVKSPLVASSSYLDASSLNTDINKRNRLDRLLNDGEQSLIENNDSLKMEELETDRGTSQPGLKINQEKPSAVILQASSNHSDFRFSVISEFSIAFSDALRSSDDVAKAFETSLNPVLASKAYYRAVYDAVKGIKSLNPVSIAKIFSTAVKATFNDLTTFEHILTYGNVAGNYLNSRGLLIPENVMTLSSSYVNFIKSAVVNARTSDSREANIQAIIDGLVNFLVYLNVYPSESFLDLAIDFSDNVFSFTGVRRRIFPSLSPVCDDLIFNQTFYNDSNFTPNLEKSLFSAISKTHKTSNDTRDEILGNSFISVKSPNCYLPSVISLFTNTFSETVSISETLANAFETRLSGDFSSQILFSIMYDYFLNLGMDDYLSHYVSNTVSQLVNMSYYAMTPVILSNTISYVIGHKLFDENLLTMENFEQLSDSYIQFLEIAFRSSDSNYTTRSIIRSMLEGTRKFLSFQRISLAENVEILTSYFAMALNSSIDLVFNDGEFSTLSFLDEQSMTSDFDPVDQTSDCYSLKQPSTAVFSDYILDEICFYPELSKLFYLPPVASSAGDTSHSTFLNSLFSDDVDSPQRVTDLILHEEAKSSGNSDSISFAERFIKSLENFLTARHVLKPENAIVMACDFVSAMNEAMRQNQDSDSNLYLLINTTGHFLAKHLIFGVHHAESWSSMLLSELSSRQSFQLLQLIKTIAPEILSSSGLLSTESSTRVNNLASDVRIDVLSFNEVDVTSFTYRLIAGASEISNGYPELKPEKALIQALLEGLAALIVVINGAYINALDMWGCRSEVCEMYEAFSGFLNL